MPSQPATVNQPAIKQEKKSQSQPTSPDNNDTQVEKVLSQKLSQLSSQDQNWETNNELDEAPELPGDCENEAGDENEESQEGEPCYLCEIGYPTKEELRREGKLGCKTDKETDDQSCYMCENGYATIEDFRRGIKRAKKGADGESAAPPKKKLESVVKAEKKEAAAASLPTEAKNSTEDPEWLTEQVAVLKNEKEQREKELSVICVRCIVEGNCQNKKEDKKEPAAEKKN